MPGINQQHISPTEDAAELRKAMKGLGTDDSTLCSIIAGRTNEQLQQLRQVYAQEQGRDLMEDVQSETRGEYELALTGTILSPAEWDARCLEKFMKGMGADEQGLIQTLAHRDGQEMEAIKDKYLSMFGKTLQYDIEENCSGLTRKFFVTLINTPKHCERINAEEVQQDTELLYNAGQGMWGTDEDQFMSIICKHGNQYLKALNLAYGRAYGDTLVTAVRREIPGWAGEALEAMISDQDMYYAKLLFKAMDGMGTDEELLIRVLTSRRHRLRQINDQFMTLYGTSLYHRLKNEEHGNLNTILLGIAEGC